MSKPYFTTSLTDELIEQARVELNENAETRQHDIQVFREMVQSEKDLVSQLDDAFLLRFLRARKFNFDRALNLLKGYYKYRLKYQDEYKDFYPSAYRQIAESEIQPFILPDTNIDNCKVIVIRLGHWNTEIFTTQQMFIALHLGLEVVTLDEAAQISGVRLVIDCEKYGYQHLRLAQFSALSRLVSFGQDTFPIRCKGLHFIRLNYLTKILYAIGKPFIPKKYSKRFFLHGYDLESLFEYIPAEILPEEYGGEKPPVDNSALVEASMLLDDYFKDCSKFGYKTT